MDYEKKYEKLVDAIKVLRDNNQSDKGIQNWVNDNVPELKEGSEDERIRKLLICGMNALKEQKNETFATIPIDDAIAWLEKKGQKETDPRYDNLEELLAADDIYQMAMNDDMVQEAKTKAINALSELEIGKLLGVEKKEPQVYETEDGEVITYSETDGYKVVEPKFNVDDLIVDNWGYTWKIEGILNQFYLLEDVEGGEWRPTIEWVNNTYHLWTIKDAKDGDVLATPNYIYIFNSIYKEIETVAFYCLMKKSDEHFSFGDYRIHDEILNSIPATKEQRDLLFQKMKEAGFGWNAEKKELKKIEAITHLFNVGDTITKKRNSDINDFGQFTITDITGGKYWYNDRIICDITEQDKWEIYESVRKNPWGEEDENMLKSIIATCELAELDRDSSPARHLFEMQANWLKSLKERIKGGH